jgi:ABC-type nitrate/sulfonate/bicarbonate transport system substrate-binding protein
MRQHRSRRTTSSRCGRVAALVAAATAVAGLTAFGGSPATTEPPADGDAVVAGTPFPEARCEANREAGTVTYLTGFDFAATAGMIGVFVAQERGYFEELCLDVEVTPSFSTSNYPLVAGGEAQVASGGSFSEVLNFAAANDADLVTLTVEGRSPIDGLILKPGTAESLENLEGATIGVKGKLPASVAAMLASVGLVENEDYSTVLLDGFDPVAHIGLDDIVGFPGYKSNEPGALDRAGIQYDLFDPIDFDIPGSFGVNFTSREFLEEHPTAVQDFVRASMRGLADAIADPEAASALAMDLVSAGGNPNYLSPEGEAFRWETESALLQESYADGEAFGVPSVELLQAEVDAYTEVGVFEADPPELDDVVAVDLVAVVYDDEQQVVWPG